MVDDEGLMRQRLEVGGLCGRDAFGVRGVRELVEIWKIGLEM